MAYSLEWLIPGKVAYSRVWGKHTLEDMQQSNTSLKALLQEGTAPVYLIMDMREVEALPTSLKQTQELLEVAKDPSLGWVVSVSSSSPMVKYLGMMIVKLFRLRFRRQDTLQEAINFLHSMDSSLDWSIMNATILPSDTVIERPTP